MMDTIFALSSGSPPAGIAVIRISGPLAGDALQALAGRMPPPRMASLARLRDAAGAVLDEALVLWFPGPATVTGENLAELHLHGGRAVVAAVQARLAAMAGLRAAEAGEFTRRAFANGRIDLTEAEGLGDLLSAETELQRLAAMDLMGGLLSRKVEGWRDRVLMLSARIEAVLDFDDEDDVADVPPGFAGEVEALAQELRDALMAPAAEMLREGFRVALAGPPNAGKSTLFNALVESDAAITAPIAGTTRDVLLRSVALGGIAFTFIDMAGLRDEGADDIEAIGIERAEREIARADLVLWLGDEGEGPADSWEISAMRDDVAAARKREARHYISARSGEGMDGLRRDLIGFAAAAMPRPGEAALNRRQRDLLGDAERALVLARGQGDLLLLAEALRACRVAFDRLIGRSATEDVLDTLFGRFCIGK
ncbi:tRNA uridine-5-carboxymethylaminomethyl(34) synthesis GTPase MnmE [Altererythrobacter xixiisoli]|uniref:tRNA modification GTPase MnmE n=1 Tax=Croceibacterium xixiisoli TaxID=1476466 RepID=A0A6I4TQK1_9SPHN|nr:tRNA uridine-5-carboxymethylaminomethyl(34) synthesis GTPase MnmE [Croceibacterium xixiisoli]MXO97430.1 tRNA uridine-5-carboxymethylaminomethyl(34) synthesis GTPase MnmE [Croceibacterium xixiisoli]